MVERRRVSCGVDFNGLNNIVAREMHPDHCSLDKRHRLRKWMKRLERGDLKLLDTVPWIRVQVLVQQFCLLDCSRITMSGEKSNRSHYRYRKLRRHGRKRVVYNSCKLGMNLALFRLDIMARVSNMSAL